MVGLPSPNGPKRPHTLSTILPVMERACTDLEAEIATLESQRRAVLEDLEDTVGGLSDLRYGKFSQPIGEKNHVRTDVLQGLQGLEEACKKEMGK